MEEKDIEIPPNLCKYRAEIAADAPMRAPKHNFTIALIMKIFNIRKKFTRLYATLNF